MDKRKLKRLLIGEFTVKRLIKSIVFIYVSLLVFAYLFSDRILFRAPRSTYEDNPEILKIELKNGTAISALYLPKTDAKFTVLFSHGNAEDLGDVRPILEEFRDHGYSIFAYDYQGYGTSSGKPSEENAYKDVEAVYKYMVETLHIPPERIIACGRSMGGALAIHLASRRQIAGLVLESSFVSAFRFVTRVPLLPFDKFRNEAKIKQVHCPVLVIHGTQDQIIPSWHGQRLFERANEPKLHFWVEGAGHNNLVMTAGNRYWTMIEKLIQIINSTDDG